MRFVKLIVTVVILGLVGAFIWQNLHTFSIEQPFELNLYVMQPIKWTHAIYSLL
jgi:cytoskeletal protein RodZ